MNKRLKTRLDNIKEQRFQFGDLIVNRKAAKLLFKEKQRKHLVSEKAELENYLTLNR